MKSIILFAVSLALLAGCTSEFTECSDVSEVIELRQLVQATEIEKSSGGQFFFAIASYSSSETKQDVVKMFGNVNGGYRLIEAPLSRIKLFLDDSIKTPYIVLKLDGCYSQRSADYFIDNGKYLIDYYEIHCSEKLLPERLIPIAL